MARDTWLSASLEEEEKSTIGVEALQADATSLFTVGFPGDHSSFCWQNGTASDQDESITVDETQDMWAKVRRATRDVLGNTSVVLNNASPSKPRQSSKELPPLVPGRSQLPQLKGTLAGSRGTKHPNLTASASTFPDDLRRRALVRSANVTVEPPRSAMKRQTGLSRSTTNKSVTFLPVSQSTAFEPSLEESLISRPLTPPLPLPTKSPNHSLRTYARSVFYPESGASAPHPRPHPPRLSVAPENSVRAATFAFTSTPRPGHEHSRNVLVHKAGQPIARVDADLSGHDEDEHENSSQISSIVDAQQSISALSRSAVRQSLKLSRTREALDRALRDQSRSEGSSDNRGSNQATRRFDVSNLVSEKTSPNQVDLGISSSSKPRPRRSSASGVCQANISPKHIPNDVEVDASNSLERSWAKASFVEQELSPDDMFARRMRDNYLLDGIDLSKSDSRRTKHSVTGFYLSEPPIVHLPSTSHQAGRAVRPQARILNTVPEKRPAAMQNLTLPREFTFTNRTRPRVEPDHTRPAKRPKLTASAAFAAPTSRVRPGREQNGPAVNRKSRNRSSALTEAAVQSQAAPAECAPSDMMAYYLDSIQGIDPLDLVNASTTDKERNVVVKLPEKLASIGQMPAAQALSSRDSISASTARPLSRKSPNRALQPTNRVAEVVPRVRSGETLQENAKTAQRKDAHVASSQESRGHYGSLSNHHKYPSSGSNRMQPRQQSSKRTVSRPFTFATGKRQRENPSQV